jgi:hypothetical protein
MVGRAVIRRIPIKATQQLDSCHAIDSICALNSETGDTSLVNVMTI